MVLVVFQKEHFKMSSMYFRYFDLISHWKQACPFIWTNLIPLTKECFVSSLVWIGLGILEKTIIRFSRCIFAISSLFLGSGANHLNKLKSLAPKNTLCKVIFKLTQMFYWRRICKFCQCTFTIFCYLPLKKAVTLYLNHLESPLPKKACVKFGWNWHSGSHEEQKNINRWRQQRRWRTDKFQSEKLTYAFGSDKLKIAEKITKKPTRINVCCVP